MPRHYVGTSGFASPATRAQLGAPRHTPRDLLASYAARFDAIELDSSFYRWPSPETVAEWKEAGGPGMAFSVRVPKHATHTHRLAVPEAVGRLLGALAPLGPQLACLLFTTPPTLDCDVELVRRVLGVLGPGVRTAWEFHHRSWACPEVVDLLVEHGSAPVVVETGAHLVSGELLPGGLLDGRWALPFVYVRLRKDRYRARELALWGELLGEALRRGQDVFAFFKQGPEATAYAVALGEVLAEQAAGAHPVSPSLEPVPQGSR